MSSHHAREIVLSVASGLDRDRLEVAHHYTQKSRELWCPESLSSANPDLIKVDGVGYVGDSQSVLGAMYRVGTESFKAQRPHAHATQDAMRRFCKRHHVVEIALFGSVLREDFDRHRSESISCCTRPQTRSTCTHCEKRWRWRRS